MRRVRLFACILLAAATQAAAAVTSTADSLSFSYPAGGSAAEQQVTISSTAAPISFFGAFSTGVNFFVTPVTCTTPCTLTISAKAGLAAGHYEDTLTLSYRDVTPGPGLGAVLLKIPASLTVTGGGSNARAIPHIADGNGFRTTILLMNTDTASASYTLRFNDDRGEPVSSGFELESGSLSGVILPGKSVTIRTAGLGTQTLFGWAELTAPSTVGGSVIYSQKIVTLPTVQEGTTPIAAASQHFFLPFDNTNGAVTSIAVTNPGTSIANVTITLRFDNGSSANIAPLLPGRSHQAFPLTNWFPSAAGQSGVAEFTSDQPLSAVVFRFNTSGAFTALGVVGK